MRDIHSRNVIGVFADPRAARAAVKFLEAGAIRIPEEGTVEAA